MADIYWHSFNPHVEGYKRSLTEWFINWKSKRTHTELEFSGRYYKVSTSATLQDGCTGDRFKYIDYTKHPERWESITIPCTDEQEDLIYNQACKMVGLKYDKIGVVLCNILSMRIIRSRKKWVWCTESCIKKVLAGHPLLTKKHPDCFNPDNGHELIKEYVSSLI